MQVRSFSIIIVVVLAGWLAGCQSPGGGTRKPVPETDRKQSERYRLSQDRAPEKAFAAEHFEDAIPKHEARSRYGNKSPYRVGLKTYEVLPDCEAYREDGIASWYGAKFHGHRTSSWEVFDMYSATAAHKTLPLPCYARVTNLHNGHSIIVKINDRGPFHSDRIIDLSFAAATRLGFVDQGTAQVRVETLNPEDYKSAPDAKPLLQQAQTGAVPAANEPTQPVNKTVTSDQQQPAAPEPATDPIMLAAQGIYPKNNHEPEQKAVLYLQVAAFNLQEHARKLEQKLKQDLQLQTEIIHSGYPVAYKVRVGPLKNHEHVNEVAQQLSAAQLGEGFLVRETAADLPVKPEPPVALPPPLQNTDKRSPADKQAAP